MCLAPDGTIRAHKTSFIVLDLCSSFLLQLSRCERFPQPALFGTSVTESSLHIQHTSFDSTTTIMNQILRHFNALSVAPDTHEDTVDVNSDSLFHPSPCYPWVKRTMPDGTVERFDTAYCQNVLEPYDPNVMTERAVFDSLSQLGKHLFDQMARLDRERVEAEKLFEACVLFHCERVGLHYHVDLTFQLQETIERVEGLGEMTEYQVRSSAIANKFDDVQQTLLILRRASTHSAPDQRGVDMTPDEAESVMSALGVNDLQMAIAILHEAIR